MHNGLCNMQLQLAQEHGKVCDCALVEVILLLHPTPVYTNPSDLKQLAQVVFFFLQLSQMLQLQS